MNPWAYWWIRWAVLGGALINLAVVVAFIATGRWYMTAGNVAAAGAGIAVCLWAPRFRARVERERHG